MLKNIDGKVTISGTTPMLLTDRTILIGSVYKLMVQEDNLPPEHANKMLTGALFLGVQTGKDMIEKEEAE